MFTDRRKTAESVVLLFRQIAIGLAAGHSLHGTLDTLAGEDEGAQVSKVAGSLRDGVSSGMSLGESLEKYPRLIHAASARLLKRDTESETLSNTLNSIAMEQEKSLILNTRIWKALSYPVTIFAVVFTIAILLLMFVIPVFSEMYVNMGGKLPFLTRLIVGASETVVQAKWLMVCAIAVVAFVFLRYRKLFHQASAAIPLIGTAQKKASALTFVRYLAMTGPLNIPIKDAIEYSAGSVRNTHYAEKMKAMGDRITDITQLSAEMAATGIFPSMILKTIAFGKSPEAMSFVLAETLKLYEKDVDSYMDRFTDSIEIAAFVLMGIMVGGFVIGMYLPIFQMAGIVGM